MRDNITYNDQDEQLKEIKDTFEQSILLLRSKGILAPIVVMNYPLAYRPALGRFEYHSMKDSYSLVEFMSKVSLTYYEIARNHDDTYILDIDQVFLRVGKDEHIRELDADGSYEHVTRRGSVYLADELLKIIMVHYKLGPKVKCVVVDLDNTLWSGIIQDDGISGVTLYDNRIAVLKQLQRRGIILAIASKNEPEIEPLVNELLGENSDIFTIKKISWDDKPNSILSIANELNIGADSLAFFDDNPYEREQVSVLLPEVKIYTETDILQTLNLPEFDQGVITEESKKRGEMYIQQRDRQISEESNVLSKDDFLMSIDMKLWIREAAKVDLNRVAEMIQRTNQLNATTIRYSKAEVLEFHKSKNHKIIISSLWDKWGEYGIIGLAITEANPEDKSWKLISFLFSCRAMGKTVERNTLAYIQQDAQKSSVSKIIGEYRKTDRNSAIKKIFVDSEFENTNSSGDTEEWVYNLAEKSPLSYSKWFDIIRKPPK
jgi:FkbH-like protein